MPEVPGSLSGRDIQGLHLLGSKCEKCGQVYFPSRRNCPGCMDDRSISEVQLSDRGTLQTFVVASMAPPGFDAPHAQGYIDLYEDGPRVFSLLVDYGDGSRLQIGCEMDLKIIERGRDNENRVVMGYRFRPLS